MTIEQEWEKYRDHKHLIGTLPKSAYVRIMLYGLALQEQMERALEELGPVRSSRTAAKRPTFSHSERKAKASGGASSGPEIVAPAAFSARKAS